MPELPELHAHSERLAEAIVGRALQQFRLLSFSSLRTVTPNPNDAEGHTITAVRRRGKYLILSFDHDQHHIIHLMQGGRIKPDPKMSAKPRGGIARWTFAAESAEPQPGPMAWLLTEAGTERKAGIWVVSGDPLIQDPLADLGPDANQISHTELAQRLSEQRHRIHGVLRDQRVLAGLGRLAANEICYAAGLSPFALAAALDDDQVDRLYHAIRNHLNQATAHERTLNEIGRSAHRPTMVHNRGGESCQGCDDMIRTVEYRRYSVFYCPNEQTGGTILADNTTSKFLK